MRKFSNSVFVNNQLQYAKFHNRDNTFARDCSEIPMQDFHIGYSSVLGSHQLTSSFDTSKVRTLTDSGMEQLYNCSSVLLNFIRVPHVSNVCRRFLLSISIHQKMYDGEFFFFTNVETTLYTPNANRIDTRRSTLCPHWMFSGPFLSISIFTSTYQWVFRAIVVRITRVIFSKCLWKLSGSSRPIF